MARTHKRNYEGETRAHERAESRGYEHWEHYFGEPHNAFGHHMMRARKRR